MYLKYNFVSGRPLFTLEVNLIVLLMNNVATKKKEYDRRYLQQIVSRRCLNIKRAETKPSEIRNLNFCSCSSFG